MTMLAERPLNRESQFGVDHRLREVIRGAQAKGLDRRFDRAVSTQCTVA